MIPFDCTFAFHIEDRFSDAILICCRVYAKIICIKIHINFSLLSCLAHNCDFVGRILFCGIWLNILWKNTQLRAYGPINFGIWIADFGSKDERTRSSDKERLGRVFKGIFGLLERMVAFVGLVLFRKIVNVVYILKILILCPKDGFMGASGGQDDTVGHGYFVFKTYFCSL